MPLARSQRVRLARVLAWSRLNGWVHDVYPNTWRSTDSKVHIRFDTYDEMLVVDDATDSPHRYRVAMVPVDSPETALRVLGALGHLPLPVVSSAYGLLDDLSADDDTRAVYRTLMNGGRHAYISTYCQHGLHDDCRGTCKCCGAECVCSGCLHAVPEHETSRCLKSYGGERHPAHTWERNDAWVHCLGWPTVHTPAYDTATEEFDTGVLDDPHSFTDAGQAFADWVDGRINATEAAELLSNLARHGHIVSAAYHDEMTGGVPADLMDDLADIFRPQS